jgi:hypothetical protein
MIYGIENFPEIIWILQNQQNMPGNLLFTYKSYSLTPLGRDLDDVFASISHWGLRFLEVKKTDSIGNHQEIL